MPYLEPELVVQRFGSYLHTDVRDAIDDDRQFVHAQVGSMSSSLTFLARELGGARVAINTQRRALQTALEEVETALEERPEAHEEVLAAVESARARLENAEGAPTAVEREVVGAANIVFESIRDELDGDQARRARRPLYRFLDTRVQTQLDVLGRD